MAEGFAAGNKCDKISKKVEVKVEEKKKTGRKMGKKWWWILAAVVALIVAVVAIVLVNRQEPIPEGYFVSDDTKLVLALSPEVSGYETNPDYQPEETYVVYYYSGDKITNAKIFLGYGSDAAAETAYKNTSMEGKTWATSRRRNGKYIVYQVKIRNMID
ncbi:hypothetical protein IKE83_02370 [Candidatus Saccharibacteria bacterium]|nr:hypothetical protein [Candidatus Saccharibacteria bacterium]